MPSETDAMDTALQSTLQARLAFVASVEPLKSVLRSGFTAVGRPESTAEHSWRLTLLAMTVHDLLPALDLQRMLQLCVLHDLGETLRGDVPAVDQQPGDDRSALERADLQRLLQPLPQALQTAWLDLWDDYDQGRSPEAQAVKALDKIETLLQHTQGANPPSFDYAFNLDYGRRATDRVPVLAALRALVDQRTQARLQDQTSGTLAP